ncbi:MAG: tRNA lysidine(34) synthetase TilS [Proteobacteria bacterium]|nr:tRNA lysidine(34) synthetase TilS [Pseudomonadota bacterium]
MDVRLKPLSIKEAEFERLMEKVGPFESSPSFAIALSGGVDSLALALLLKRWIKKNSGVLFSLTVDHGLRPEASQEAQQVSQWMKQHSIPHTILQWRGPKPKTHLQEKARLMRHELLESYCRDNKIQHLFFAHHQADQQETFLLRFLQKSGIDGLSGMAFVRETPFVRKLRPLLKISKERFYVTLEEFQQPFIKDPSNQNLKFRRVQLREQKEDFDALGISGDVIETLIEKSSWVREALEKETIKALFEAVFVSELGYASLDLKKFRTFSFEIARRVLERIIFMIGGKPYAARSASLLPLVKLFQTNSPESFIKTLNSVLLKKKHDILFVMKEPCRSSEKYSFSKIKELSNNQGFFVWEDRFLVKIKDISLLGNRFLKPLGKKGILFLKKEGFLTKERKSDNNDLPLDIHDTILETLPSLWENEKLLSVPHLGWGMLFWQESGLESLKNSFFPKNSLAPFPIHVNFMENNF